MNQLFVRLLEGGTAWRALLRGLSADAPAAADAMIVDLQPDERYHLLMYLLLMVRRGILNDSDVGNRLFDGGETMGVHVLPTHFYSPLLILGALEDSTWRPYDLAGVDWREDEQQRLVRQLGRWSTELEQLRSTPSEDQTEFHFDNSAIGRTDAAVYYNLIRELRPRRVLEVGGGYSTLLAAHAAVRNESTLVDCIEPYPMEVLRRGVPGMGRLIEQPVQQVPLEEFTRLEAGDILFIDCSHVSRIGSDVNHLILRVLPHLRDGVLIHIHDIFLPDEYPKAWVKNLKIFWNEQYLVHAFLSFNTQFRILCSTHYLGDKYPELVRAAFPFCAVPGGGSLWFERCDPNGAAEK